MKPNGKPLLQARRCSGNSVNLDSIHTLRAQTVKMVFTAFLLGAPHEMDSVEATRQVRLLPLDKALKGTLAS